MNINNLTQELNILGFKSPTAIQKEVWNPLTSGENIIGISPTGSGKTLAFLVPLINNVKKGNKSQLLIIEPNQELAMQTLKIVRNVCNKLDIDLNIQKIFLRLSYSYKYISKQNYETWAKKITDICNMLGGWIKSCLTK